MARAMAMLSARGQIWQQVEFLEHEADLVLAQFSTAAIGERGDILPADTDLPIAYYTSAPRLTLVSGPPAWSPNGSRMHQRD
jgi:hypothetical protein